MKGGKEGGGEEGRKEGRKAGRKSCQGNLARRNAFPNWNHLSLFHQIVVTWKSHFIYYLESIYNMNQ